MNRRAPSSPNQPHRPALAAVLCGLWFATALAFAHKTHVMPGVCVLGVVAFCMAANLRGPSPRKVALLFAIPAALAYAWLQNWVIGITLPGYLGLVAATTAYTALGVWLAVRVARRARTPLRACVAAAIILAAMDFARGRIIFSGYPWYTLGQPTLDILGTASLASLIGMHGVNTALCLLGAPIAALLLAPPKQRRTAEGEFLAARLRMLFITMPVLVIALCAGAASRGLAPAPIDASSGVPVGVVQTNVPQSNKQSASLDERVQQFVDAADLTRQVYAASIENLGETPAFIAWPETMFTAAALNDEAVDILRDAPADAYRLAGQMRDALLALQSSLGAPMLVGAMALENPRVVPAEEEGYLRLAHDGSYNSVFLVDNGAVDAVRYDKMHLTPFGEVMPLISRSDWLEQRLLALGAPGMSFDLDAGTIPVRFEVKGVRVAAPICFEATMPHVCRRLVFEAGERRAGVLLNATNDGWFGAVDAARRDHLLLARWRAAELATPVVRAANTGMSCFIDAHGRVYSSQNERGVWTPGRLGDPYRGPARTDLALLARVVPGTGATLYARTGDVVGWAALALGLWLSAAALWPGKNRANPEGSPNAVEPTPD